VKLVSHIAIVMLLLSAATRADAAPLSMPEAKKIALIRVPGTIVHEKLKHKKKKKGHEAHDIYSIKIKPRDHAVTGMVKKVEVDKETGQIIKIKDVKAKSYDD
jgi:uncharacterized membrane protein YkoI